MIASYLIGVIGLIGFGFGCEFARRLYRWEKLLRRSRIVVTSKGKVKMNRAMIDWMMWAQSIDRDKHANGQVVYVDRGVSIAVLRPVHRSHGKAKTRVVKTEMPAGS